jgi:hypothetical protein
MAAAAMTATPAPTVIAFLFAMFTLHVRGQGMVPPVVSFVWKWTSTNRIRAI